MRRPVLTPKSYIKQQMWASITAMKRALAKEDGAKATFHQGRFIGFGHIMCLYESLSPTKGENLNTLIQALNFALELLEPETNFDFGKQKAMATFIARYMPTPDDPNYADYVAQSGFTELAADAVTVTN
jgi:hypothetical protein